MKEANGYVRDCNVLSPFSNQTSSHEKGLKLFCRLTKLMGNQVSDRLSSYTMPTELNMKK